MFSCLPNRFYFCYFSGSADNYNNKVCPRHFPSGNLFTSDSFGILTNFSPSFFRTIVNGLCYLATCVFGINSVGLLLYSIQLTISSLMEPISGNSPSAKKEGRQLNTMAPAESSTANVETGSNDMQQNSSEKKD